MCDYNIVSISTERMLLESKRESSDIVPTPTNSRKHAAREASHVVVNPPSLESACPLFGVESGLHTRPLVDLCADVTRHKDATGSYLDERSLRTPHVVEVGSSRGVGLLWGRIRRCSWTKKP